MKVKNLLMTMTQGLAAKSMLVVLCLLFIGASAAWAEVRPYAVYDSENHTLTFMYGDKETLSANEYELSDIGGDKLKSIKKDIYKVVFDASFAQTRPTTCDSWFAGFRNLESIEGMSNLNTEDVTNMAFMFSSCYVLKSLDLSNFNTANVTTMDEMFYNCYSLETIHMSSSFNTSKVTDMFRMFYSCRVLTSLDLSSFNTSNVEDMSQMFTFCYKLGSLDLTSFNTEKITDMGLMFYGCSALESINLSTLSTANVTSMKYMFCDCKKLKSLDLSNFNTANVTDMYGMFYGCELLTSLDLTSFNTANVIDMHMMFMNCFNLEHIYVDKQFTTDNVTLSEDMLYECKKLPNFKSSDTADKTHANLKAGGYFSTYYKTGDELHTINAGDELTADCLDLADDKDFTTLMPFTAKAASYSRTISAGTTWATLCLPFEVELEGQNFRAFQLDWTVRDSIVVLMEIPTSIAAGTPAIIKMNNGATTLTINASNKPIAQDALTVKASYVYDNSQLVGLYTKKMFSKETDDNCYILKGNKLMNASKLLENSATKAVGSKAFRAYFVDNSTDATGAKMYSLSTDGSTTAINGLNEAEADGKAEYYDLQGHRLNDLQKGVNIIKHGNKTIKVIIR